MLNIRRSNNFVSIEGKNFARSIKISDISRIDLYLSRSLSDAPKEYTLTIYSNVGTNLFTYTNTKDNVTYNDMYKFYNDIMDATGDN
jgi:hypothetical protein